MPEDNETSAPENPPKSPPETSAESEIDAETGHEGLTSTIAVEGASDPGTDETLQDTGDTGGDKPIDIEFLLDIPLQVKVEVGRTRMLINDLLQLNQGSVIELQKLMGEPFEVVVNDKLIARGEVVVVNERFGIRLTDIISPTERIQQLV